MKRYLPKIAFLAAAGLAISALAIAALISGAYLYLQPSLPTVEAMRQIELQVPLRVYSRDGKVIAQIGEQRRIPVTYDDIPPMVRQAFIAAEEPGHQQGVDVAAFGLFRLGRLGRLPRRPYGAAKQGLFRRRRIGGHGLGGQRPGRKQGQRRQALAEPAWRHTRIGIRT